MKANIHNPLTEADKNAASLYSRRRHLREYRDAYYAAAEDCLSKGDKAGWDREQRKAWALEDQITAINVELEKVGIW